MSRPEDDLDVRPTVSTSLPGDQAIPAFAEPWQAQAFAMVLELQARGHFTWPEWSAALSAELTAAQRRGDPDDDSTYYHHWLAALESILTEKGKASRLELKATAKAWAAAYARTPHGQPVVLGDRPGAAKD